MPVGDSGLSFQGLRRKLGSPELFCVTWGSLPSPLPSKFSFPVKLPSLLAVARAGLGFSQTVWPLEMSGEDIGPGGV